MNVGKNVDTEWIHAFYIYNFYRMDHFEKSKSIKKSFNCIIFGELNVCAVSTSKYFSIFLWDDKMSH